MIQFKHTPVLLEEAIEGLQVRKNRKYIDATIGGGGHAVEILKKGGIVLGIDLDEDAIGFLRENVPADQDPASWDKLKIVRGNFSDIKKISRENGFDKANGILFDLGVSSYQLDASGRGFSIKHDEQLDMRMGLTTDLTALEIVNNWREEELERIFLKFGEEGKSKKVALAIVRSRRDKKIETTGMLQKIIGEVISKTGGIHPATRVFQAIRIVVNNELEVLKKGLQEGFDVLDSSGRMVVISFHSLEDRIVKNQFRDWEEKGLVKVLTKKPITASAEEIERNRRARSAKLRIAEKKI